MIDQRNLTSPRIRRQAASQAESLSSVLASKVVGQPGVIDALVPCVEMFQAGLSPENRPVGVFLLLGPTGTGKTRTVEALAEALHGSSKSLLKIDCGEYQMEHEVAKLIGAPPGYLGHRETQPALTQQKLTAVASEKCGLSLVLFDEIEKAAPSMARLMLGLLDRGILRLGDNTQVSFENTIVFMTSNLGAREMMREIAPEVGFQSAVAVQAGEVAGKLKKVAMNAVRRKFSPEFVNRIDHVITYQPLEAQSFAAIVDHEVEWLRRHVVSRLGTQAFVVDVPFAARQWLMEHGTSVEYGARELKRIVHRHLTQPLATMVTRGQIEPGTSVRVGVNTDRSSLSLRVGKDNEVHGCPHPTVLVADGNRELLQFMDRLMSEAGWDVLTAGTATEARRLAAKRKPHAVMVNAELPDERGMNLAVQLCRANSELRGIVMTGGVLSAEENDARAESRIAVLEKPFLVRDALNLILSRRLDRSLGRFDDSPKAA
jgi:ATP-dependent Clp protease ATP-binding subunit ClpA/ActR/RegA family two-component response regulator